MKNQTEILSSQLFPINRCYQLKFIVTSSIKQKLIEFLSDRSNDLAAESRQLELNRLYFDTTSAKFNKQCLFGLDGRFNFMVSRQKEVPQDNNQQSQYFIEVRKKQGLNCAIYRATSSAAEWLALMNNPFYKPSKKDSERQISIKQLIAGIAQYYQLQPELLTQYERVSYYSNKDSSVKITLDSKMKCQPKNFYQLELDQEKKVTEYNHYLDNKAAKNAQAQNFSILKLSFESAAKPIWLADFVKRFNLQAHHRETDKTSGLVSHFDGDVFYDRCDRILEVY